MKHNYLKAKLLNNFGWGAILLVHLVVILLRLLYAVKAGVDLDPEEAQYWLWSKHPDWSYYSKPPLIAYINGFTTGILGNYAWAVRLNAILLGSLIGLLVYHITRDLYKRPKLAFVVSVGLLLLPGFHYISLFFTTDVLAVLGWLLTTYLFWKAIKKDSFNSWALAGVFFGIGLLGKYTLLYFIPFSFLYLLFTNRRLLKKSGYYLFLFTGIFIFLPVIIWNLKHGMLGVLHVAHLAGAANEFPGWNKVLAYQTEFFGGQLLLNLPLLCILFFWKKYGLHEYLKGDFERYVLSGILFVVLSFTFLAFFKRIRINWLLFSYFPLYLILLKAIWQSGLFRRVKVYMSISFLLLVGLIIQPIFATQRGKVIPVKVDPFSKLIGWQHLAEFIDRDIRKQTGNKDFVILSDKYQVAAQLSFYTPGQPTTYCLPYSNRRMNQYDVWGIPEDLTNHNKPVAFVKDFPLEDDEEQHELINSGNVVYNTTFSINYKGEKVKTYYIYLLEKMPVISKEQTLFVRY
ncbi:glycosyltransferase family 39 protein [Salinimicrobium gaetbulicola]|uniref:Glycosyltransferase family 39 protein n=1 Tax=Salinimicrobium gaetbulicola TaxID=999702 RepID=A0ABW3IGQ9_9FLAO